MPYSDPEKQKEYKREYYRINRERFRLDQKIRRANNAEAHRQSVRDWRKKNPDRWRAQGRKYSAKHRDRLRVEGRIKSRLKRQQNPEYFKGILKAYRERNRTNVSYQLLRILRNRFRNALRGKLKAEKTSELIGCSIENLRIHLESQFESGMSWDNHGNGDGEWNVDHVVPCALFDMSSPDHQRRCFHFSNLQPMWHIENIKKGKRFSGQLPLSV
jgi:hypothetical protein